MSRWREIFETTNRTLFRQVICNHLLIDLILYHTRRGGRIMEAGCGTGLLSILLADSGYDVVAVDNDDDTLSLAQQHISRFETTLQLRKADLFDLVGTFHGEMFDTICHSGVLEHFSDERIVHALKQQRTISEKVVFRIPNHRNSLTDGHYGDERFMSNGRWVSLIEKAGFRDIEVYGGETFPRWVDLLPRGFFLTPNIYQSARANRLAVQIARWRKYVSRHTIFVCSG